MPIEHPEAVYPRVGGGTDLFNAARQRVHGLSPRGRGNLRGRGCDRPSRRSIPAWAGEPVQLGLGDS